MKKLSSRLRLFFCLLLSVAICVAAPCMAFSEAEEQTEVRPQTVLKLWQIDSFEGGRGSRADFLQNIGNAYAEQGGSYVNVTSLSAEAARLNLAAGIVPDLVSYGAGTYGLETFIADFVAWCYGGYCMLTLDANADFSDVSTENTVVNGGKDNLVGAALAFCGLRGATVEKPTGAYVSLINGEYKYLFGTQRDVYRLKTRGVSFTVKAVTQFNDLYQNISVTAQSEHVAEARRFIDYLLSRGEEVTRLGLFTERTAYDDELKALQGLTYEYRLTTPVSADLRQSLEAAVADGDINMLKNLLK